METSIGIKFGSVTDIICDLRSKYPHPRFLVIHAGGNDIRNYDNPLSRQQKFLKNVMVNLSTDMPSTCIVWSHILPRLYWRHLFQKWQHRHLGLGLIVLWPLLF